MALAGLGSTQAGQTPGSRERPARVPSARVVGRALSAADEGCALRREPGECETAPWNYLLERAQWLWLKHLKTLESVHSGQPSPCSWQAPTVPAGRVDLAGEGGVSEIAQNVGNPLGRPSSGLS